jgi:hypothetical protein
MPWISAVTVRYQLRETARRHLQDQKTGVAPRTVDYASIADAFIGGDAVVIQAAAEHAEMMLPIMEQRLKLNNAGTTADFLNLVAAATSKGVIPVPRIERLLKVKSDSDPITLVLRWIAECVLHHDVKPPRLQKRAGWVSGLTRIGAADALDQVLIPDHPEWVEMQAFVLPLSLLLASTTQTPLETYARVGGHPTCRGEEIYVRISPRPPVDVTVIESDSTTWPGFDAVERKDDVLLAYHYLNQGWQAPIVFQPDIDGLPFLRHIRFSWKLVEEAVTKETWKGIQADIDAGRVKHVIAYDRTQTFVAKDALQNASREYGIVLEAADFLTL